MDLNRGAVYLAGAEAAMEQRRGDRSCKSVHRRKRGRLGLGKRRMTRMGKIFKIKKLRKIIKKYIDNKMRIK
jgi:hypothetical protein